MRLLDGVRRLLAQPPRPARDEQGRFVSASRRAVLARARRMRAELGLPPAAALEPTQTGERA